MSKSTTSAVGIVPEGRYTLKAFRDITGISETRMYKAKREGIALKTIDTGRRKHVTGVDAIEYIDKLGRLHETKSN